MKIIQIIFLSFSVQALVLCIVFLAKKNGDKLSNILWATILFLFAYNIFYNVLKWSNFDEILKRKLELVYFIPLSVYGPIFYLYIKRLITKKEIFVKYTILHFIPLFLVLLIYLSFYLLPLRLRDILEENGKLEEYLIIVNSQYVFSILIISNCFYAILTYVNYKKDFKNCHKHRIWLNTISVCFLLFSFGWLILFILEIFDYSRLEYDYFITIIMIIFILLTSLFAHLYSPFNTNVSIPKIKTTTTTSTTNKYKTSGLSESLSLAYKEKLESIMLDSKLHLNNELNLVDLAKSLGMSRHHTSQVINEHFYMGYYDFINKHRIEEVKKNLTCNKKECKIIDVAYKAGFNNKVSFYKAFNKFVGMTPGEYIANLN